MTNSLKVLRLKLIKKGDKIADKNNKNNKRNDDPVIKLYAGTGHSEDYEGGPHGLPQKLYEDTYEEAQDRKKNQK